MQWARFGEVEPWDMRRMDLHAGIVASTIANANRVKGQRPFRPGDFMPDFEPKPPQTGEQMRNLFVAFARAHNEANRRRVGH